MAMHTESESKVTLEHNLLPRTLLIEYTGKGELNLKKQQSNYMRKHGKKITLRALAGQLLEKASL